MQWELWVKGRAAVRKVGKKSVRERERAPVEVWQQTDMLMEIRLSERQSVSVASHTPHCFLTATRLSVWAAITEHCNFPLLSLFLQAIKHQGLPIYAGFSISFSLCLHQDHFHSECFDDIRISIENEMFTCRGKLVFFFFLFFWWQTRSNLFTATLKWML